MLLSELSGPHKFSCVMANFPADAAKRINKWSKENIPDDVIEEGREQDSHVTVLYGLHTNDPDKVRPVLTKTEPFSLAFGKISKFEQDGQDVIKIEIKSKELRALNDRLAKLPHTNDYDYNPHCTIAYVKPGSCDEYLGSKVFDDLVVEIAEVVFSPGNGNDKTTVKLGDSTI